MGQILKKQEKKCTSHQNDQFVLATCRQCNQYVKFYADPFNYKNPQCECFSTNVSRSHGENQWYCYYCNKTFYFKNDDEISCKCGVVDWDYFLQ